MAMRLESIERQVTSLMRERAAVQEREREFIEGLSRVLGEMGYRLQSVDGPAPRRRRRRHGRPRLSSRRRKLSVRTKTAR